MKLLSIQIPVIYLSYCGWVRNPHQKDGWGWNPRTTVGCAIHLPTGDDRISLAHPQYQPTKQSSSLQGKNQPKNQISPILAIIWRLPEMEVPLKFIHFHRIFLDINHPAIGVPPFTETLTYPSYPGHLPTRWCPPQWCLLVLNTINYSSIYHKLIMVNSG